MLRARGGGSGKGVGRTRTATSNLAFAGANTGCAGAYHAALFGTTMTRSVQTIPVQPPRIAVIVSRYNASVTDRLRDGAVAAITERYGPAAPIEVVTAPGAFELPALALAAARTGRFAGIVALGCLVHGQTRHDRYIAAAVAQGLVEVTMRTGIPAAFGVITAETAGQAVARAGGKKGNKGREAAEAVLDTIEAIAALSGDGGARAGQVNRDRSAPDKVASGRVGTARRGRAKMGRGQH